MTSLLYDCSQKILRPVLICVVAIVTTDMVHLIRSRLFIGLIAFTCTEIFAGSSAGPRLYTAWTFLVTFWLYFAHLFFFASLAYYTQRTSLRSLYLWGCLFGLYESWVTKVIWFGYPGEIALDYPEGCSMGGIYGFCINESLGMVFFWHPIFGFLFPITIASMFEPRLRISFQGLSWFKVETFTDRVMVFYIVLAAGSIMGINSGSLTMVLVTWIPILLGLWLGYRYLVPKWYQMEEPLQLLVLERKGFIIATVYLITLYVSFYFFIIPYNQTAEPPSGMGLDEALFPGIPQLIITILAYLLIIGLLYYRGDVAPEPNLDSVMVEEGNMLGMLQTIIVLSMIMGSIAVVPLIIVSFVLIPVIGGLLFLRHGFYWK